ncbi:M48 family metalloprotease [Neorhizobium galegae]|uniref:M48 family metallopeptidase n=1 Tax=Neorhizobium galegae TaxID=399 RepID=UPI002100F718|nr:M48 family metallopeptidase [Neorhizobium galegae]MCQ1574226.1 M48 family metalloprotease [Neorhizobium galegae]MCQ1837606.1 M48 family metalloprotease [Neorhizobium galegae]
MRKFKLPPKVSLVLWLFVFPATLFGLGLWQAERASQTLSQSSALSQELRAMLAQVKKIAESEPGAILTFQGDEGPNSLSAMVAVPQIQTAVDQADEDLEISSIRQPIPWGTAAGALLAFVSAIVGLATAAIAGVRARRSQDQLVKSFERLRNTLPFVFAALIIGICVSTVCASLFEAISIGLWTDLSAASAKLFVAGLVLAGVAIYSAYVALRGLKDVFALFTPEPLDVSGHRIDEAAAPGLFRFVRDLADRQQAVLPDTIIVGLTQGFFVTESLLRLWPEDEIVTGRTLYLPAPYLDLLDEPEVAAIIGHELAHFSGKDTIYSQRFTPIYAGLWRSLAALRRAGDHDFVLNPAVLLGFHAIEQFDRAVNHWSRIREFDADRNGTRSTSTVGAASALIRTGLILPALEQVLSQVAGNPPVAESSDTRPDLVSHTSDLVRASGWSDPVPLLEDRQPHPTDTHPPTRQRIQALGLTVDERLLKIATRPPKPQGLTFASGLFSDWKAICAQLSQDYLSQARAMRAAHRQTLQALAAAVPGETIVYNNVKPTIWAMAIIALIFIGFGLTVTVLPAETGFGNDDFTRILVAGVAMFGVAGCGIYVVYLQKSAARPLMILTPTELQTSMLDTPVAWIDVAAHQVFASNRFALRLWMDPSALLPAKKRRALYSKVDRKEHVVTLGAMGIRGMKPAEFSELIGRYHNAAHASKELSRSASEAQTIAADDLRWFRSS